MHRLLASILLLLLTHLPAFAQLDVGIELQRRMFLRGESIEAKVTIRNLSGHDIVLRDTDTDRWFGFEVMRGLDTPIGPIEANYQNPGQPILAGETVERTVDLLKLFPINELGAYSVRATIFFPEMKKYIVSPQAKIDISDGKILFSKTVGVPNGREGAGEMRDISLIQFQTPKFMGLYGRVEDHASDSVLATFPLGRIVGGAHPICEFSEDNTLYALHMNGPSQYALSKIGVNGEWLGQSVWISPTGRAAVRKKPDGTMVVVGASRNREPEAGAPPVPKLSDRPVVLPSEKK